jgi:multiple sugar transport system substrate-binding protein
MRALKRGATLPDDKFVGAARYLDRERQMGGTRRDLLGWGAGALIVAGTRTTAAQESCKLRVTAASSDLNAMWRELVKAFEETYPNISVDFDNSTRSYDDLVQATLRAAIANSLPDVSFQGANRIRIFVDRGLAIPLGPFLDSDNSPTRRALSPSVSSVGRFRSETYALGVGVAVPLVFYNLDLIQRVGVSGPPADWNGILDAANKVQELGQSRLGAYFQYDSADWLLIALIESQGGRMMSTDERKVAFDGPEGLKALRILEAFGRAGQAEVDMSRDQAREMFAAGRMGAIIDSVSNLTSFEKASAGNFTLATGPFPVPGPNAHLPAAGSVSMMFATDPNQQKLAWEFLKFASGPAGQKVIGTRSGWLPANDLAIRDPQILGAYYESHPRFAPALSAVPQLDGWYAFPGENAVKITKTLVDQMRDVVTLKVKPDAALAKMARDVAVLLPPAA